MGIARKKSRDKIELRLSLLTREYILHLNRRICDGCGVCATNCPKDAIKWIPPKIIEGRLARKPAIDFEVDSCILCGECSAICPLDALKMEIDGEEIATIVKNEAFPVLLKEIKVSKERCESDCNLVCQKDCPTKAIQVKTKNPRGRNSEIIDVLIDKSMCIYCKHCELACPQNAIHVKKPFLGKIEVNTDVCPEGCRVCVDICPAKAAQLNENGILNIATEFCVYCFACEKVCPKNAIKVNREWIFHSEVRSAVWLTALKKLTSEKTVLKEASGDSARRRSSRVRERLHETP